MFIAVLFHIEDYGRRWKEEGLKKQNYTIPSDNRELQPEAVNALALAHYTIPSDNRELQQSRSMVIQKLIIPYQVITGNYN